MNETLMAQRGRTDPAASPARAPLYRVAHWDEEYETNETRKLKELRWVRLRNQPDDLGYRRLVAHPRACELLAAWLVILQVASRGPRAERGRLMRQGEPLVAEDLALISGLPAAVFELALPLLAGKAIGWLEVEAADAGVPVPPAPAAVPAPGVRVPGPHGGGSVPAVEPGKGEPEQAPSPGVARFPGRESTPPNLVAGRAPSRAAAGAATLRFEPVRRGLYRREYEAMLADVERELRAIREAPGNYQWRLRAEAVDLMAMLEREGKRERAAQVRSRRDAWEREGMRPEAAERLSAWQQRKAEIKAAMSGVIAAEA